MSAVRTTCPYCGVGCGIVASPTAQRDVAIKGDTAHPANRGKLCSKGTHLGETVGLEGRLLHPMIGETRVTWDMALDDVAARLADTVADYGPDSVAFYVSGQLLTEDYYVANKLMKGFIGSGNIDTNSRLCMASAVAAHNRAFGEDLVPCTYADLDAAELIVLVGSNTAWCHPVIWQRIEAARERTGAKLVVIDPRRTETAERADLHVAIAPDGDVALFNALLAELAARGQLDTGYLAAHCEVPVGYIAGLDAAAHGIDPATFAALADLVAAHPRMVTMFSMGVNQSVCGTDKANAIINLHLATGRIGLPGAGPFSMTGQPNAMGGREVGGLANMLACHLGFAEDERAAVRRFWKAPNLCGGPGLKAVDMFRAVHDGRIRFLWVMATNPAVSMPDAAFVREALARCPNVVVSDVIADTDTSRFAHVRLPALAWGEKDGTVTNSERVISRQRPFFAPPGEARADWRTLCDVAARLGHGSAFAFASPAAVFREYAAMTALAAGRGKVLDLVAQASLTDAGYDALEPSRWGGEHPLRRRYPTPSGRARVVPVEPPPASTGLRLNTGRYRDQWHTMTRTGLSPRLAAHRREPLLEVSPGDAATMGLVDGGLGQVTTPAGAAVFRVAVHDGQAPGAAFAPMHWTDAMASSGRTGALVVAATDPHSGQPGFKNVGATLAPVVSDWHAFVLSREPVTPVAPYWVRSRIAGGWLTEVEGKGEADLPAMLPAGTSSEVRDAAHGMVRTAVTGPDGALLALAYVTRTGTLPQRDWLVRQFAGSTAALPELLAGRPAQPQPDSGPLVCVCHDVGENAVRAAICAGAGTVAAVGAATCAGTNCGSCRPLISRLIAQEQTALQEAAE
ncbi:nitrate reductase [Alteraurantiacibacter buctensis]|uniref:Molybdopterin-dependent oxidoreductase n=1 Tax=Alteraurantiacibacter buctensis TaxID=1503981 RepID=A0A844Z0W1_9SPHN|nr:nitrate reductase [Alteraurantiacibacter buctensis]MXO73152.1 molybdopterin-dependent oxidoreductase [Alteraurantiacibacter buctensis]